MKPDVVVMVDKVPNDALGIFEGQRSFRPDGLFFEGAVITFQFTVVLWVIGRAQDVGALPKADKFLEVFGYKLRPVVANEARPSYRMVVTVPLVILKSVNKFFSFSFPFKTPSKVFAHKSSKNSCAITFAREQKICGSHRTSLF
jgi:hypothetical protein